MKKNRKFELNTCVWFWNYAYGVPATGIVDTIEESVSGVYYILVNDNARVKEDAVFATEEECLRACKEFALDGLMRRKLSLEGRISEASQQLADVNALIKKMQEAGGVCKKTRRK